MYNIYGKNQLKGSVLVSGSKNSSVALIPACLLTKGNVRLNNIPNIIDVKLQLKIMNIPYTFENNTIFINTKNEVKSIIESNDVSKLRGSYYLMGALLGRNKKVEIKYPGGCNIGERPIDIHLKGFKKLGCIIKEENGFIKIDGSNMNGAEIDVLKSVGATINIMFASVSAKGVTFINNPAMEPEIDDVIKFLNKIGHKIKRYDNRIIVNNSIINYYDCTHTCIPDRIETLTYIIIGLMLGEISILNANYSHVENVVKYLIKKNGNIKFDGEVIRVKKSEMFPMEIVTSPYPGFPTDVQQLITPLLCLTKGKSVIYETIFENRFENCKELNKMGANIEILSNKINIFGVKELYGKPLYGSDLRGTASLVIAALAAKGKSEIMNINYLERGYDNFIHKIKTLGGSIEKNRGV